MRDLEQVEAALDRLVIAFQPILDKLKEEYSLAGAPYGDDMDGMLQWIRELMRKEKHVS